MSTNGGLHCEKHGGYIGECPHCKIEELKVENKMLRGLCFNKESHIDSYIILRENYEQLDRAYEELRIMYNKMLRTDEPTMFESLIRDPIRKMFGWKD